METFNKSVWKNSIGNAQITYDNSLSKRQIKNEICEEFTFLDKKDCIALKNFLDEIIPHLTI